MAQSNSKEPAILCVSDERIFNKDESVNARFQEFSIRRNQSIYEGDWIWLSRKFTSPYLSKATIDPSYGVDGIHLSHLITCEAFNEFQDLRNYNTKRLATKKPEPPFIMHYENAGLYVYTKPEFLWTRYLLLKKIPMVAIDDIRLATLMLVSEKGELSRDLYERWQKAEKIYSVVENKAEEEVKRIAVDKSINVYESIYRELSKERERDLSERREQIRSKFNWHFPASNPF